MLGTSWDQCVSMVQYCFTSTETIRLFRTATSTFTQLPNSDRVTFPVLPFCCGVGGPLSTYSHSPPSIQDWNSACCDSCWRNPVGSFSTDLMRGVVRPNYTLLTRTCEMAISHRFFHSFADSFSTDLKRGVVRPNHTQAHDAEAISHYFSLALTRA